MRLKIFSLFLIIWLVPLLSILAEEPIIRVQILSSKPQISILPASDYNVKSLDGKLVAFLPVQVSCQMEVAKEGIVLSIPGQENQTLPAPIILESKKSDGTLLIEKVPYGVGWWWENAEDRSYRGILEIHCTDKGNLQVISVLPIEDYLCGVVPTEIGTTSPMEALKAQAVAARSETLNMLNRSNHPGQNFDICSDVHCQAYSGCTKENSTTNQAVRETKGIALFYEGKPIGAYYASNCGGHSENVENVWPDRSPHVPYWSGHYDTDQPYEFDLTKEEDFEKWIKMKPRSYCHPDNPGIPQYAKKYFRWERKVTAKEIQDFVAKKKDVGRIRELRPKGRGVSGRLLKMDFVGEKGTFTVGPELAIRQVFNPPLYSAAFVVETEGEGDYPETFIFKGGGWGHGVGMCQTGAVSMATQGKTFKEILLHYYRSASLEKAY